MNPRFPPEIFDLFIGALAADHQNPTRIASLKSCSLVSKSFSYSARIHIFSTIVYRGFTLDRVIVPMKMNVLDALRMAIERDSHLAANVRRFEIHLRHKFERDSGETIEGIRAARTCLTRITRALVRAAKQHPSGSKLDTMQLEASGQHAPVPDFSQFWRALGRSYTITTLNLRCIPSFPIHFFIRALPCLQKLEIWRCDLIWSPELPSLLNSNEQELACPLELYVDISMALFYQKPEYGIVDNLRRLLSKLETLQFRSQRSHSMVHANIIKLCKSSLRALTLTADVNFLENLPVSQLLPTLNLGTLSDLQSLSFEIHRCILHCRSWVKVISELLIRASTTQIKAISIHIFPVAASKSYASEITPREYQEDDEAWQMLDAALVRPEFSALRTVDVRFFWPWLENEVPPDAFLPWTSFRPTLPLLYATLSESLRIKHCHKSG
ncbi:hypothetical protein HYPSUDRAFT_64064 [Hypholoma sublateritium FD-334 SS-4]|uniref:F-box domain-containing protein n=1 Tax=Hypholoma sublateritium (strain FD-334 SS-4) TaxID=945553 RepID=A0A0D2PCN9_HYPSF|nr:hypothetical protein HYPSUDRAFT_64064 [Hypholoma sublateritium FD-334 SS-4]